MKTNAMHTTQCWCCWFQEHNGGGQEEAFDGLDVAQGLAEEVSTHMCLVAVVEM